MTVKANPLPIGRMLRALDEEAQATMRRARKDIAPIVAREVPRASGRTARALRPKTSRTKTGTALTVRAGRTRHGKATVAQVVRWVNRGTGLFRTTGTGSDGTLTGVIRSPRGNAMVLPGGKRRRTVKGQRPNPFMVRINQTASPRVRRITDDGARRTGPRVAKEIR